MISAKAICFKEAQDSSFKDYGKQVIANARALARGLVDNGLKLVGGAVENHLVMIDLADSPISGKKAEALLQSCNITTNKNTIPNDQRSAFVTSGVRLGTAAITTRGFKEQQAEQVGQLIAKLLTADPEMDLEPLKLETRNSVRGLTEQFPLYRE